MASTKSKPIVVATAFPAAGHAAGLTKISAYLVQNGYTVYFITGSELKPGIEKTGAQFIENPWDWEKVHAARPADADVMWDLRHLFADSTHDSHRVLKDTLERVRREYPDREVLLLHESLSCSLSPFAYGAPLPEGYTSFPKVINFHTSINITEDGSVPPFGPGIPYDPTPENLALWKQMAGGFKAVTGSVVTHWEGIHKTLGTTRPITGGLFDFIFDLGDVTVFAASPSLDYPMSNPSPRMRFIGGLPLQRPDAKFVYPTWWPTITANAALPAGSPDKKKVVFVTQGTAHLDYDDLLLPTIKTLGDRSDLIVVATLGVRGATLKTSDGAPAPIPANTLVIDYLAYDALLPYADVFVTNAGYGGFMHGIMNGVPMVLAGTVADKAEVSARAEWIGVGVNLRTQKATEEAIRAAVEKVLSEEEGPKFKAKALELKKENEDLDALNTFEGIIAELTGR
ncbi:glycosyltransferase family 1 protein [Chaetomium sp. MPI-SDFR-AT-0129]|nr:glycosyltransferase family 1 protein [Chaetomium sp. MPI-SDFR-AT-0129]